MRSHLVPPLADFKVGVDNVIFSVDIHLKRLLVLLSKRDEEPFSNCWSFPGALVRQGESLEAAAQRVLFEKIQVKNLYLEQLFSFGGPGRDPREEPEQYGVRYLSVSYFALLRFQEAELLTKNLSRLAWHNIANIPELAFDHNEILNYGHQRLQNKLKYSPIAFEVLPHFFTLYELYQLYATVLGENFSDYSNFRTRLLKLGFLEDTGRKKFKKVGRPATLFCFNAQAFAPLREKPLVFM
jgi:ADP-ribose pyrophosphatase YjhB (NUDIX family)